MVFVFFKTALGDDVLINPQYVIGTKSDHFSSSDVGTACTEIITVESSFSVRGELHAVTEKIEDAQNDR